MNNSLSTERFRGEGAARPAVPAVGAGGSPCHLAPLQRWGSTQSAGQCVKAPRQPPVVSVLACCQGEGGTGMPRESGLAVRPPSGDVVL